MEELHYLTGLLAQRAAPPGLGRFEWSRNIGERALADIVQELPERDPCGERRQWWRRARMPDQSIQQIPVGTKADIVGQRNAGIPEVGAGQERSNARYSAA